MGAHSKHIFCGIADCASAMFPPAPGRAAELVRCTPQTLVKNLGAPMTFSWVRVAVLFVAGMLTGCASEGPVATSAKDTRPCATNFRVTGSFVSGQTFSSFEEHPGADRTAVFERVVRSLTTKGYSVTSANKDLGIISALNPIIMGKGSRATLNAAVSDSQNKVRVDTTFAIPGLTGTSTPAVRDEFCTILKDAFAAT